MRPADQSETTSVWAMTSTIAASWSDLSAGCINDHESIVLDEEVKESCEFAGLRLIRIKLLRTSKKVQTLLGCSHEPIEQRNVHAMKVPQGIETPNCGFKFKWRAAWPIGAQTSGSPTSRRMSGLISSMVWSRKIMLV